MSDACSSTNKDNYPEITARWTDSDFSVRKSTIVIDILINETSYEIERLINENIENYQIKTFVSFKNNNG